MQLKQRIARVHGGNLRWRRPDAAANGGKEALVQRIMQHMVATSESLTTSLDRHFWSLLSSDTDAKKAGVAFAKAMDQLSEDGRGMVDAMTTPETRSRHGADSFLRSSLGKLITEIFESQKIMRNVSFR